MRSFVLTALPAAAMPAVVLVQAAPSALPAGTAAAGPMTNTTTPIGDILDNAAAKAVLQKHLPTIASRDQIDMARSMTLRDIQSFAADEMTDAKLAAINRDFASLKR